jgi:superfamily I DNA/RNA helicase
MPRNLLSHLNFFHLADAILKDLDRGGLPDTSPQRAIITVEESDRVLQILAGPGSGKTEMLVWRVLFDLCVRGTQSDQVMVTTFTRRAATELNVRLVERCEQLLGKAHITGIALGDPQVHNLRIGTIHSLCDGLLAEFDDDYMASGTQVIDEPECVARLHREQNLTLSNFRKSQLIERLVGRLPLTALFRPPWDIGSSWPTSQMDRVAFLQALLNQQVETWHPRCSTDNRPNGIDLRYPPATDAKSVRKK